MPHTQKDHPTRAPIAVVRSWVRRHPRIRAVAHRLLSAWYAILEWRDRLPGARFRQGLTPHGFVLVARNDAMSRQMLGGTFAPEETAWLVRELADTDVFVDAGANIGYFTCVALHHGIRVVAVEPQARNLECLHRSVAMNQWTAPLEVHRVALGPRPLETRMFGDSMRSASLVPGFADISPRYTAPVSVSTLDDILGHRFADQRLLIKIDVIGYELGVVQGARATLARTPRPRWAVEICLDGYHPDGLNPGFRETFELFWEHGYEARTADAAGTLVRREDVDEWWRRGRHPTNVINYAFITP